MSIDINCYVSTESDAVEGLKSELELPQSRNEIINSQFSSFQTILKEAVVVSEESPVEQDIPLPGGFAGTLVYVILFYKVGELI